MPRPKNSSRLAIRLSWKEQGVNRKQSPIRSVISVVSQTYQTQLLDEYVIVGNDALLRCTIPSYVSDFVSVVGWVDDGGGSYLPASAGLQNGTIEAAAAATRGNGTLARYMSALC